MLSPVPHTFAVILSPKSLMQPGPVFLLVFLLQLWK
jgi:hypothetical protein